LSETTGFVGYYCTQFDSSDSSLTLVYFQDRKVFEYEVLLLTCLKAKQIEPENGRETLLKLEIDYLPNLVRQELVRRAEKHNLVLDEFISSIFLEKKSEIPLKILQ
jgi:hypothetical protein